MCPWISVWKHRSHSSSVGKARLSYFSSLENLSLNNFTWSEVKMLSDSRQSQTTDFQWGFECSGLFKCGFYRGKKPGHPRKSSQLRKLNILRRKGGFQNALSRIWLEESCGLNICSAGVWEQTLWSSTNDSLLSTLICGHSSFRKRFPNQLLLILLSLEMHGHQAYIFKFDNQKTLQCPHYQKAVTSKDHFI